MFGYVERIIFGGNGSGCKLVPDSDHIDNAKGAGLGRAREPSHVSITIYLNRLNTIV